VVSVARTIIGRLVVGCEEARQSCPGGDAVCREIVKQGVVPCPLRVEVPRHVVFIASRGTCRYAVHLEPYTWVGATVVFLNSWLEVFWVTDRPETS
jgi:hypothetical protein